MPMEVENIPIPTASEVVNPMSIPSHSISNSTSCGRVTAPCCQPSGCSSVEGTSQDISETGSSTC